MLPVLAVVLPVSFLYDMALTSLTPQQLEVQTRTLLLFLPPAILLFFVLVRRRLLPIAELLKKLEAGEAFTDRELTRSERRSLLMPYLIGAYAAALFFSVSILINFAMYYRAGLGLDMLIYLEASSITTALMFGLGASFFCRPVFREVMQTLVNHAPAARMQSPFFIPISVKVTGSLLIIVALILIFSGLLSSVITRRMVGGERRSAQASDLAALANLLDSSGLSSDTAADLLDKASGPGRVYLFLDRDLAPAGSSPRAPSAETLAALREAGPGNVIVAENSGWIWSYRPAGQGIIVSGREPVSTEVVGRELARNYGVAALVAFLAASAVGFLIARDVSVTLRELSQSAAMIAEGKTDVTSIVGNEDETGTLARAFNHMSRVLLSQLREELDNSRAMIETINTALETLSPMSEELVSFAGLQASSSVEQSAAAAESAASCTEVASISANISENSGKVVEAAEGALQVSRKGQDRIRETKSSFQEIGGKVEDINQSVSRLEEQSRDITGIVIIIEEISDQINLLAFNASLEAAGAGEHGRRFGVVAGEILRLANRTSESTRRIKAIIERMRDMIGDSIARATEGVEVVQAGQRAVLDISRHFDEVYEAGARTVDMAKTIDTVTRQQSTASDQMAKAMEEVRDTAHQGSDAAMKLEDSVRAIREIIIRLRRHAGEDTENEP